MIPLNKLLIFSLITFLVLCLQRKKSIKVWFNQYNIKFKVFTNNIDNKVLRKSRQSKFRWRMSESIEDFLIRLTSFLMFIATLFGFFGNFLSFLIFSTTSIRKNSISIYFALMAIFDSVLLVNSVYYFISDMTGFLINRVNDFFCRTKNYFFYAAGPVSPWLMVAISTDRFIRIGFPKRFMFFSKRIFQVAVISTIITYNFALYSFIIWNSQLERGKLEAFWIYNFV